MHANRLPVPALVRGSLTIAAGLALLLGVGQPAAATSYAPVSVALGTHRFGHLRAPDSIVAHADPSAVGFYQPPAGQDGVAYGPWSFDVARDGSIWLLDVVKHRLLSWRPGQPDRPAGSVRLPQDPLERVADFAVAPDDSIYATYVPPPGPGPKTLRLAKLTPDGKVLWTAATTVEIFNARLRIGPDDALYVAGGHDGTQDWTPLTTPAGRPLSLADQRRGTSAQQPLPGGLRLAASFPSNSERRFMLSDEGGRAGRAWRVTSKDSLGAAAATPALVGGDPVVVIEVSRETKKEFLYELEVLRLARTGASVRFALAPEGRVVWGDTPITGVRIGPDGQLYQLRTSRTGGVDIARYSLDPVQHNTPPTTAPAPKPSDPKGQPIDNGGIAAPPTTVAVAQPAADPAATRSAVGAWLPWVAGVAASALAGLVMWLLYRRRHPAGMGPRGGSGVSS
jgi:hypothetical protein